MGSASHPDDKLMIDTSANVKSDIPEPEPCAGFDSTGDTVLDQWLTDAGIQAGSIMHNDSPTMRRLSAPQVERLIGGMPEAARGFPGVEIEYYGLAGERIADRGLPFSRVRLVNPPGGAPKYLAPAGSSNHLYVPPNFPHEAAVGGVLIITEGEKKAIVACAAGYPTVALAGVHQWAESVERRGEKEDAEGANKKPPHLKPETPIMQELLDVIEKTGATAVHVLFDSDGAALDKRSVTVNGSVDPRFVVRASDKKYVMNQSVAHAGRVFADALRRQTKTKVSLGFVPHGSQPFDNDYAGKIRKVDRLTKRGLDDWIRQSPAETVHATLEQQMSGARRGSSNHDSQAKTNIDLETQGYIPLGYSPSPDGTVYHVWSKPQRDVKGFTDAALARKTAFYGAFGVAFCDSEFGEETLVKDGDKDKGTQDEYELVFDLDIGQRKITESCLSAGLFHGGNKFGAGAWDDGCGGLEINCASGRFHVSAEGEIEAADHVVSALKRTIVFPTSTYGDLVDDRPVTNGEIAEFVKTIATGWNFRCPADGMLVAGWLILQAYTAAGPVRPSLFLTGPTSAGKTALTEVARTFLGPWGWYVNDSSNASVAFLRGQLGSDCVTVFMDEAEPAKIKSGGGGRLAVTRDHIEITVRALRSSYNSRIIASTGAVIDDPDSRAEGRVSAGGKGSAGGATREERLLTSVLFSAISMPETDQADRDRMITIEVDALTDAQRAGAVPTLSDKRLGGRVFAKMWRSRAAFVEQFEVITPMISAKSPKVQQSLAAIIAALAVALDLDHESADVADLVSAVNTSRCSIDSDHAPRADHEVLLNALLTSPLDVEITGGQRTRMSLAGVIRDAALAGMGSPGPSGTGGDYGAALRLRGMSARRGSDGKIRLFVARDHAAFSAFAGQTSFANVYPILARAPGVTPAIKSGSKDTRVGIDGRKCVGIWIDVDVDADPNAGSMSTAESLFEAQES